MQPGGGGIIEETGKFFIELFLMYIFIAFLFIPGIGLLVGVKEPIGAVMSDSMEHNGNFTNWWEVHGLQYDRWNITKEEFQEFPFKNGVNTGDLVLFKAAKDIKIGDVIVFKDFNGKSLLHRVVSINPINTQGDANYEQLPNRENNINNSMIRGKILFKIPYLGWVRIGVEKFLN